MNKNYKGTYYTKTGYKRFDFAFIWMKDHYDIEILSMPSYGIRSSDIHSTHRLSSKNYRGKYRICFGNSSATNTYSKARKWASIWAELTMSYILYGKTIPNN